jgi:hypothetical protein
MPVSSKVSATVASMRRPVSHRWNKRFRPDITIPKTPIPDSDNQPIIPVEL